MQQEFLATYQSCNINKRSEKLAGNDKNDIANRSLKNICLAYLAVLAPQQGIIAEQFKNSDNMTDTLAALQCSAKHNLQEFKPQMASFEQTWQDTTLVMDKWFMINASLVSDDIFQHLDSLVAHPLFTLKNPNRARSLISAFTANNPRHFHCISGRGYQFLAKQIAMLNVINPQVASRLITPLIQFKGLDKTRQQLIKTELVELRALDNLSKDLVEKLDAALS